METGKCLCGKVSFTLSKPVRRIYRCHCSLCQKQTGAAGNAATFVNETEITWVSGSDAISSYVKDTGFRSDFCNQCGSPVPNRLRNTNQYWVPVGLLEGISIEQVVAHICTSNKPSWEPIPAKEQQYPGLPELESLKRKLYID